MYVLNEILQDRMIMNAESSIVRGRGYGPFNSTILAFACRETRTRTKTKSMTTEKTFNQDSLPLNQDLNLLFTYILT